MQARDGPFGHAVRRVDGRRVGRFDEVLRDDVDHALARLGQVAQAVFGVVVAAGVADAEDGGILGKSTSAQGWLEGCLPYMVDGRRVAERREIRGTACAEIKIVDVTRPVRVDTYRPSTSC